MNTFVVAFLFSLMVSAGLTLVVRNRALRYGWIDQASSSRKIHSRPIPRLGGIGIIGGFFAPLVGLLLVDSGVGITFRNRPDLVFGLFGGGLVIAALGLWDDFRGTGAKQKFSVQILVALGLYALGFRVEQIANPFGAPIALGYLALPFTLLWIVGIVNAMNLIDGLDGLAGGVAFFGVATNFILAIAMGKAMMTLIMAALGGAILGFLIFNFNPASIFMGDTGSMFLGFVVAAASLKTSSKSGTAVAMLVPVIALGLPIMDTLLAMTRRTLLGRPMFSADKEHIHHRLMSRLGVTHRRAVLVLYGLCCIFGLTALSLAWANSAEAAILLCGVGVVVFVLMRKLGYLSLDRTASVIETRKKNGQLRTSVREITGKIRSASTVQEIWTALRPVAELLDSSRLELRLEVAVDGIREKITYEVDREEGLALPLECRFEAVASRGKIGELTIVWRDGRPEVDRDEELALELLADAVGETAARLVIEPAEERPNVAAVG